MVKTPADVPMWRLGGWPRLAAWVVALTAVLLIVVLPLPWFVVVFLVCVALVSLEWDHRRFHRDLSRRYGLGPVRFHPVRRWLTLFGGVVVIHVASSRGAPGWLLTGVPLAVLVGLVIWFVIKLRQQGRACSATPRADAVSHARRRPVGLESARPERLGNMEDPDATPISYQAVKKDTPVLAASGEKIGDVEKVLDDSSLDLFDGITVQTEHGLRFADRDTITEITDKWVKTTFDSATDLPEPGGAAVYRPNEDARSETSFTEWVKDGLGDDKPGWERQKDET